MHVLGLRNPQKRNETSLDVSFNSITKVEGFVEENVETVWPGLDRAPVAQLVEHRVAMREVVSPIPAGSTLRVFK